MTARVLLLALAAMLVAGCAKPQPRELFVPITIDRYGVAHLKRGTPTHRILLRVGPDSLAVVEAVEGRRLP